MVSSKSLLYGAICLVLGAALLLGGCSKDDIGTNDDPTPVNPVDPEEDEKEQTPPVFPETLSAPASLYINTPNGQPVSSRREWIRFATIRITGDDGEVIYEDDSLKIRGRGNSTWYHYPKKPYYIKLDHQANFFGTGKSKRWVLSANWMDRTLLRNEVAFEAARRTSLEWTPSGDFVELYLNGRDLGLYWLGEKINVEGSKFKADYLFSFDTSDSSELDFTTVYGYRANAKTAGLPTEIKYPDRDDEPYATSGFASVLKDAQSFIDKVGKAICENGKYESLINTDSFCDWYLVHELCGNAEPNHPKSCFFHSRDGVLYAGPVWDFDWGTFKPGQQSLRISQSLWFGNYVVGGKWDGVEYYGLLGRSAFKKRLKERWSALKPQFESLPAYIDARADWIREREAANHDMWPCFPNPLTEDGSGMINNDEQLTFQEAVDRLKAALLERIDVLDREINAL